MNKSRIARIQHLEEKYQTCRKIADSLRAALDDLESHRGDFKDLFEYSTSKSWMEDFEADERGEFPKDMKRGILSEDGLYSLCVDYCNLVKDMTLWEKMNGDITDEGAMPYMEEFDDFDLFDPQKDDVSSLPDFSGNYVVALRPGCGFPGGGPVPEMSLFNQLPAIYTGQSGKSLKRRIGHDHLKGHSAFSTLRITLGCLLGFPLIPRDKTPDGKHWRFSDENEKALSKWMEENLLFYYRRDTLFKEMEKVLISFLQPPLNIDGYYNANNEPFRTRLKELRRRTQL